jgi:hypothetical protein
MKKIKLLYDPNEPVNFTHGTITPHVLPYFDLVAWDQFLSYDPADYVVLTNHVSVLQPTPQWWRPMQDRGFKVIVDHLWDSDVDRPSSVNDNVLTLRNGNWLWYRESWYYAEAGYHHYRPNRKYKHCFFMPMNKAREHKQQALTALQPVLNHAIWSYVAQGHLLPGDCDHSNPNNPVFWLYYMNPEWYDSTCFSVVVESYMRSQWWANDSRNYKTEISEKTFKPMAFFHPFIVFGSYETLKYLHREGFETFDNLWDESYDSIVNDDLRHAKVSQTVIDAVNEYWPNDFVIDAITEQKLQHNHARFFDHALIETKFVNEVIGDIANFIES